MKLILDHLSSEDAAVISKKLTELSARGAKAVYDEFSEEKESCSATAKEWNDWRVFMRVILNWESRAESTTPKKEVFFKLISIAQRLTDKSDADKLQELVLSCYMGQYMSSLHKGNEPKVL